VSDEFDTATDEVVTSGNIAVPVATALVVFLLGLLAGGLGMYLFKAPEEVEVEVPRDLTAEELREVKQLLGRYFGRKAVQTADRAWDDRGLTDGDMDAWLRE